jgi:dephospho-CoA kinase
VRIERVEETRNWDKKELLRREACQPSIEEKEEAADVFIENNGTLEALNSRVEAVYKNILIR